MTIYAVAQKVHDDEEPYLTAGKRYPVIGDDGISFTILDDDGYQLACLWRRCAHLIGGNWERIEE